MRLLAVVVLAACGSTHAGGGVDAMTQPDPPSVVASGLTAPNAMALDGDYVYFLERATTAQFSPTVVARVPRLGGAVEVLVQSASNDSQDLVVDDRFVYFNGIESADGAVLYAVPKTGGAEVKLASGGMNTFFSALGADADSVYFIAGQNGNTAGKMFSIAKSSQTATEIGPFTLATEPALLVVQPDALYAASYNAILRVDRSGATSSIALASTPSAIALDGDRFLYTDPQAGQIDAIGLAPGAMSTVVVDAQPSLAGLALDGTKVYWARSTTGGAGPTGAVYVEDTGASPVALADQQASPYATALDARGIYWINYGTFASPTSLNADGEIRWAVR